jgi:GTPase SAR1 family protein
MFDDEINFLLGLDDGELYIQGLYPKGLDLKLDESYKIFQEYIFSPSAEKREQKKFLEALLTVSDSVKELKSAKELGRYLQAKMTGEIGKFNYARVLLLGNGGSGKTSLVKKIKEKDASIDAEPPTPRIEISTMEMDGITADFWDFGGQVIMHSTHTFFLSSKSSYIIVCNRRNDEQPDFWLELLEAQLSSKTRILIVHTHVEGREKMDDSTYFRNNILSNRFPDFKLDFFALSNKSAGEKRFKEFKNKLKEFIKEEASEGVYKSLHKIYKENLKNIITLKEIKEINQQDELKGFKKSELLLNLIAFGYLFPLLKKEKIDDYLSGDIFIWQKHWLTYGVYELINSELTRKNRGRISKKDFKKILFKGESRYINRSGKLVKQQDNDRNLEELRYDKGGIDCLYKICKNYNWAIENSQNRSELIFPHAVPLDEPGTDKIGNYNRLDINSGDNTYIVILFDSIPNNLFFEFIALSEKHILEPDLLWRSGVILFDQMDKGTYGSVILNRQKIEIKVTGENQLFLTQFIMYYFIMLFRRWKNDRIKPQIIKRIITADNERLMVNVELMNRLDSDSSTKILEAIGKDLKMGNTYNIYGTVSNSNLGDNGTVNINIVSKKIEGIIKELKEREGTEGLIQRAASLLESKTDNKPWYRTVKTWAKDITIFDKTIASAASLGTFISGLF